MARGTKQKVSCPSCGTQWILDAGDLEAGRFWCDACNETIAIQVVENSRATTLKSSSRFITRKNLILTITSCSALAILVLLFPFRIATLKMPGKMDSSANLGPTFIFTSPTKIKIYNAIYEDDAKGLGEGLLITPALSSRLDYGRTLLLMTPFIAVALVSFFWLRKLE